MSYIMNKNEFQEDRSKGKNFKMITKKYRKGSL